MQKTVTENFKKCTFKLVTYVVLMAHHHKGTVFLMRTQTNDICLDVNYIFRIQPKYSHHLSHLNTKPPYHLRKTAKKSRMKIRTISVLVVESTIL